MDAATLTATEWWAATREDKSQAWIANYQQSLQTRHRDQIAAIVAELQPSMLMEVGCHCGPNLVRLTSALPDLWCLGIDPSQDAIAAGQQWMGALGVSDRVELRVGAIPSALMAMPSGAVDVVLSCYTLAYIAPADLDAVLYELGRIARRAVILAEPMQGAPIRFRGGYQEWAHDYHAASRWIGSWHGMTVRRSAVEPPVDRLNAILVGVRNTP